ncbi:hypothetical protein [Streptomyces sp. H39-S7]|uniref:hypothetical protein n=1 Tax=Streptomyces sp. H39-S7 TaxID=3004357 RepID=UPI0022AFF72E|nr:hypothetical protein [Streptomyces sp. H39-S7]MCZ4126182.1 hypothetical protein [Streptomyces sp. H39-S7]
MTEAGTTTVTARVAYGTKRQLADKQPLFTAERSRARALATSAPWDWDGLPCREAAANRAQRAMYRAHLRETASWPTRWTGWWRSGCGPSWRRAIGTDWPALPAQAKNPGRWPGTRDGDWPERVTIRLPAGLVNQVLAACWHTSADAIGKLRDWRDKHPDMLPTKPVRYPAEDAALAEYEELAAQVTPAGDIWRAAVQHAIAARPVILERQAAVDTGVSRCHAPRCNGALRDIRQGQRRVSRGVTHAVTVSVTPAVTATAR